MNQTVKVLCIILLITITVISGVTYTFLKVLRSASLGKLETVKQFQFLSGRSLDEWEEKLLSENKTDYSIGKHYEKVSVRAYSDNSASALFYKDRLSCKGNPFVSWDWLAEAFPVRKQKETLTEKDEFDFVAQVYVIFHDRFFLKTKAIQYVWTENIPVGAIASSPYTENVKLLVLQSGNPGEWKHEDRNIREDFWDLFGEELEKDISAVAFMTDSDSTASTASACYGNIKIGYLAKLAELEETGSVAKKRTRNGILRDTEEVKRGTEVEPVKDEIEPMEESTSDNKSKEELSNI